MSDTKMKITRSQIAEWVREVVGAASEMETVVNAAFDQAKNPRATVFGEMPPAVQAVLNEAVKCGLVQFYCEGGWETKRHPCLIKSSTCRLDPACKLAEDSRWVEYAVKPVGIRWHFRDRGGRELGSLDRAHSRTDYVCIKVQDATDDVFYIVSWDGPYGHDITFNSVEDLVAGKNYIDGGATPLTPIAVVFAKQETS